jgi:PKD repeat protein
VVQSFNIDPPPPPGPQTITFAPLPDRMLGTPPLTVTATASSGLTVVFSTTTPISCTSSGTNGATITLVAVGTCSVIADQAGNAQFEPAPTVQQDFTVQPLVCTPPVAQFTVNPASGNAANNGGNNGTLFTFNSNATTNMTLTACNPTWSWNFGDSTGPSSVANPTHTYSNANKNSTRRVTLVASNLGGQSSAFRDIVLH